MKKILLIFCSFVLIAILAFTFLFNDTTLEAKRADIVKQANGRDVSNLLILKKSPVKSIHNRYKISPHFPETLIFSDTYSFRNSSFQSFGIGATIFFGPNYDIGRTLDENTKKITFQGVEAYYNSGKLFTEDDDVTYMYHELSFLKDDIYYLITGTYILDSSVKDTFDFISFLEENLVSIKELEEDKY